MNKILLILTFLMVTLNAEKLIIKKNSGKEALSFSKKDGFYLLQNNKKFNDKVKIIIKYKNNKFKEEIEKKYNLLNGKDRYGMYFIYEQNHDDIIKLFEKLSSENNIKAVYPNWITSVKKF